MANMLVVGVSNSREDLREHRRANFFGKPTSRYVL